MRLHPSSGLALLVVLLSTRAVAQPQPHTLSVTVAGGASLGSYEGGYLYYVEEMLARNQERLRLRIATGTSAGSTNALLVSMASCLPGVARPEDSPLYTTWSRSLFDRLFVTEHVGPLGMFSRTVLNEIWNEQEAVFDRGLPEGCELVVGVPATRLEAFETPLTGSLEGLPRSEEIFVVRIVGRGEGRAPLLENYVDRAHAYAPALLPIDGERPHEFQAMRDLVFASSSFPFFFSPYPLPHCIGGLHPTEDEPCRPERATHALFADGGLLDNKPLRLASTIARTGLVPDRTAGTGATFRDVPDVTERELPSRTLFLYLDPGIAAYPFEPPPDEQTRADSGAFETYVRLTTNSVAGARARELTSVFEDYPELRERVRVSHAYVPQTSDLLYGFFGLFDAQFLTFDFVLGMVDAERMVTNEITSTLRARTGDAALALAEPPIAEGSPMWRSFACIRAFLHGIGSAEALCRGDDLEATRILLQLAIERLYLRCGSLPEGSRTEHAHCRRAMAGEAVPSVPHLRIAPRAEDQAKRDGESAIEHATRRLADLGFTFAGLGLDTDDGDRALLAMRRRLGEIGGRFVAEQPRGRQAFDVLLRYAMNELVYTPPRAIGHIVAGRHFELGVSLGSPFGRVRWLRGTAALSVVGLESLIASGPTRMAFGAALGLEIEPIPISSATLQLRFGARMGYALGTVDDAGTDPCPGNEVSRLCSRAYIDSYVALSIAEAIRLQISAFFYPGFGDDLRFAWFVGPTIGVQLRSRE